MVLDKGSLAEYDKPAALLARPETIFSSMVEATGPEQSSHLHRIANGEIGVVQSLQSLSGEKSGDESFSEDVINAFRGQRSQSLAA
jgi:hypothetical protein